MMMPNLASRPFLNTRPVWIVTCSALLLAIVFLVVNVIVYVQNTQDQSRQIEEGIRLTEEHANLEESVRRNIEDLRTVPWRRLESRVGALNVVIKQHSFSWLVLLRDVEEVLPYDVRLVRIGPSFDQIGTVLELTGVARTDKALLELLDNLVRDERFSEGVPTGETWPEKSKTTNYEFGLRVRYSPERSEP
jgi:Tfp pilus assembly protein PilN